MEIPDILVVTNDLEIAQLLKNSQAECFFAEDMCKSPQEVCLATVCDTNVKGL